MKVNKDLELIKNKVHDLYINCHGYGLSKIEHKLFILLGDVDTLQKNVQSKEGEVEPK